MTDLRIDLGNPASRLERKPEVSTTEPVQTEVADTEEQARQLQETAELLAQAGLDHVPTIEEAKALLDARRAEIRQAVLMQADQRDWCYDGTRQVCANLRLAKPDQRRAHTFRATLTMQVELSADGFTEAGAIERWKRNYANSGRPTLSASWFNYNLGGRINVTSVTAAPLVVGDQTIALGDTPATTEEAR